MVHIHVYCSCIPIGVGTWAGRIETKLVLV